MHKNSEYRRVVAKRRGHSSVGIMMERYGDVTRGPQQGIGARVDGMLRGGTERPPGRRDVWTEAPGAAIPGQGYPSSVRERNSGGDGYPLLAQDLNHLSQGERVSFAEGRHSP